MGERTADAPWAAAPPRAVLLDFHGTLFAVEDNASWVRAAGAAAGRHLSDGDVADLLRRLGEARRSPEVVAVQRGRDTSPDRHREATAAWLRAAGIDAELIDALYRRLLDPAGWRPYPDTFHLLRALARHRVPVAVISNTGWDLRTTFAHHGLRDHVDVFCLSWEHGIEKPAAELFLLACEQLSVKPDEAIMVGDDPATDGGALEAGLPVYLLPSSPRPARVLSGVVGLFGLTEGEGERTGRHRHDPLAIP